MKWKKTRKTSMCLLICAVSHLCSGLSTTVPTGSILHEACVLIWNTNIITPHIDLCMTFPLLFQEQDQRKRRTPILCCCAETTAGPSACQCITVNQSDNEGVVHVDSMISYQQHNLIIALVFSKVILTMDIACMHTAFIR